MSILNLNKICKSFDGIQAVNNLSFEIKQGQIFGLLGPNGAGKSTTIRMVMDILKPDSGDLLILGQPNTTKVRDSIGYMPEERGLYKKMTVLDTIAFFAGLKSIPFKQAAKSAEMWLEKLDLLEWKLKKVEDLSKGMQQKLQFICTIIHNPKLIILDEPFSGLDPVNTNLVKDIMLDLKKQGSTIIFSTHLMDQVEKLCESICLIDKGKTVLNGNLAEIKKSFGINRIVLRYEGNAEFLNDKSLVKEYNDYGQYVEISPASTPQVLLENAMKQVNILEFKVSEPTLNEIFITMVKK